MNRLYKNISKLGTIIAFMVVGVKAPAQQNFSYVVSVPSLNTYGPWYALTNTVTVPTNTVAGVQVGTNVNALTPVLPLKPGVSVGVWANYMGGGTTVSNLYFHFGTTYGNIGSYPNVNQFIAPAPFPGGAPGTNTSTVYTSALQLAMPLNGTNNSWGYAVLPASALVGAAGLDLIGISTDATNATPSTVSSVIIRFSGP